MTSLPPLAVVAWVHIDADGRLLHVRSHDSDRFFVPGGKQEAGETDEQTLLREVVEEVGVHLDPATVRRSCVIEAPAYGKHAGRMVRMACYTADPLPRSAPPRPAAEIVELAWLTTADAERVPPADQLLMQVLAGRGLMQ